MKMKESKRRSNMRPLLLLSLITLLFYPVLDSVGAEKITVVADGKSDYVIAVAENGGNAKKTMQAALLLQKLTAEATGVSLPIMAESKVKEGTSAIYLGKSKAATKAGIDVKAVKGWSYQHRAADGNIYLIGEDLTGKDIKRWAKGKKRWVTDKQGGSAGTLKAVTAFLERFVGVRFVFPGPLGIHVPKVKKVTVPSNLNVSWSPPFQYIVGRAVRPKSGGKLFTPYSPYGIALNYFGRNGQDTMVLKHYGSHSYPAVVPTKKYFKSNPEYFALIGGKRTGRGNHLCVSNPTVQEMLMKDMEEKFKTGYEMVYLSPSDGYQGCECEQCRAVHPDHDERLWIVHRKIAEKMYKKFPKKKVVIQSYQGTLLPPKTFKSFPPNVIIHSNRYTEDYHKVWEPYKVQFGHYIPKWLGPIYRPGPPRYEVDLVRFLLRKPVVGIYVGGGLDCGSGSPWGLNAPLYYVFGKAMENPKRSADELEHEFIQAAFGNAAGDMMDFFVPMHRRAEFLQLVEQKEYNLLNPKQRGFTFGWSNKDLTEKYGYVFAPKTIKRMSEALERAKEKARSEKVKARLELVEAEFRLIRRIAEGYLYYRAYQMEPSWNKLEILEKHVNEYKKTLAWVFPNGKPRTPGGGTYKLRPPFDGKVYKLPKRPPYNWDFDLLRKKKVLPGATVSKTEAHRIASIKLDGKLDKDEWTGQKKEEMGEISMGKGLSPTSFMVAYDDNNLYLGFRGDLVKSDVLDDLYPQGRDGRAWKQENLELMIDPKGDRKTYYHYIVNPVPESSLERRFGYHSDPDHPLYKKFEWDWRGDWEYKAHIYKKNKFWSAELKIPFKTLEAKPPKPGDVWTMNVGRNEFYEGHKGKSPKHMCYLWSPNLATKTFHDISVFGELVFK